MEVKIKNLDADMLLKTKGIDLDIQGAGVLSVKKTGLVWTKGKVVTSIPWKKFLECVDAMNAPKAAAKAAPKAKAGKKAAKAAAAPKAAAPKAVKKVAKKKAVKKAGKKPAAVVPAAE